MISSNFLFLFSSTSLRDCRHFLYKGLIISVKLFLRSLSSASSGLGYSCLAVVEPLVSVGVLLFFMLWSVSYTVVYPSVPPSVQVEFELHGGSLFLQLVPLGAVAPMITPPDVGKGVLQLAPPGADRATGSSDHSIMCRWGHSSFDQSVRFIEG